MKKYISEFTGTMLLVICGCGSAMALNSFLPNIETLVAYSGLPLALTFGLTYMALWYTLSNVSGCHLNPAVSLGTVMTGRMKFKDFVGYVISQFLGGIAGSALLWAVFGSREFLFANGYYGNSVMNLKPGRAFAVELLLSFIFVLFILGATAKNSKNSATGIICGLALTSMYLVSIPFSNGSLNPARSLGAAIFTGGEVLRQVWLYLTAPFLGAIIAVLFYLAVLEKKEKSVIKHKKSK